MRSRNLFYLLSLTFTLFVSCVPDKISKEAPFVYETIVGEKFRINLKEDHQAGETWSLKDDFNHESVEHLNTVWHGQEKGIDVNFLAVDKGKTTIELQLIRQKDTVKIKRFIVDIRSK